MDVLTNNNNTGVSATPYLVACVGTLSISIQSSTHAHQVTEQAAPQELGYEVTLQLDSTYTVVRDFSRNFLEGGGGDVDGPNN